jgi:hypothetical protein
MCIYINMYISIYGYRHLVVVVSNPRFGRPIADTESLFVPFKGQFEDAGHAVAGVCRPPRSSLPPYARGPAASATQCGVGAACMS